MIISEVSNGKKASYSLNGTVLTVEGVTIDLQQRQESTEQVIDICLDNQLKTVAEGLGAWYVATIIVPPLQHEMFDTGEIDDEGNPVMDKRELPLDINKVELRLWGLPVQSTTTADNGGIV